jgi:hypothetical protein
VVAADYVRSVAGHYQPRWAGPVSQHPLHSPAPLSWLGLHEPGPQCRPGPGTMRAPPRQASHAAQIFVAAEAAADAGLPGPESPMRLGGCPPRTLPQVASPDCECRCAADVLLRRTAAGPKARCPLSALRRVLW